MKYLPRIFTRWIFWLVVAGVLLLYTLGGFFLVPWVVQSQLRSTIADDYHRVAQVGKVRFNPFTFVLEVNDFSMPDSDGRPMLGFAQLKIDFELMSILRRAFSFKMISLQAPNARLVMRPDGKLNLIDLVPKEPASEAAPKKEEGPTRLFIEAFIVNAGRIDLEDLSRPSRFATALKPITFTLRNFSTFGTGDNAYRLEGESVLGERLSWNGRVDASPFSSSGEFAFTGVHAQTVWDYIRDSVGFEVPAGMVDLTGSYTFSLARDPVDLKIVGKEIKVDGLAVRPKGSTDDYVTLGQLMLRDAQVSVADRRVEVASIAETGGKILTWLEPDGTFNLSRLAGSGAPAEAPSEPASDSNAAAATKPGDTPPAAQPTAPAPNAQPAATASNAQPAATSPTAGAPAAGGAPNSRAWQIVLPLIETSGLEAAFEDRSLKPIVPVKVAPIDVKLAGYDSAKPGPINIDAHIGIDERGKLSAQGTFDPNTLVSALDVELNDIDLRSTQPYIARVTDLTLLSGRLGAKGKLEFTRDKADALQPHYVGTLSLAKLRTIDNALEQDFIRWEQLDAKGIDYDGAASKLAIKEVAARKPYARVIIASNGTVNISEILRPTRPSEAGETSAPAKPTDAKAESPALDVRIGTVRIDKGSANFADFSLTPNFATGIQELSGTVTGLSSRKNSRAKVDLDGKVDAYAPVTIDGEVNYFSAESYTDLKLAFDNMELTTFTPYAGKFAGYRIEKGKLSVRLNYKVENRQLNAQHKFVLDQLQLGERVESKDATSLPVKLAVALMKDRNGVIDIDLPITGSLDDPQFRLGPLIWKAVVNLFTKIVTAPFAWIGSLFGGGDEVNQLSFAAGSSDLQGDSATRIQSVGKALHERPSLQIEVPITVNPALDGPFLQKHELEQRLIGEKRRELLAERKPVDTLDASVLADREEYRRLLHQYVKQAGLLPPDDKELKSDKPPPAEELEAEVKKLEDLAMPTIEVPETVLDDLGKERAQKVQGLLLGSGEIDPSRLFIVNSGPAPGDAGLVRMDLALR
ncbi:MAG TPA: DUF748 domain-containing protein [Steroidobacteraceae bacterium]|nr:DUF748 domain-containing protein [Steroidobacteraceae bacterium]